MRNTLAFIISNIRLKVSEINALKVNQQTLISIKPTSKPVYSIEQLKIEVDALSNENAVKHLSIPYLQINVQEVEKNDIFSLEIIGNETSAISELISELKNSDWVKKGLNFIPEEIGSESVQCPFCQQKSIKQEFIESIHQFFDETYEKNLEELKKTNDMYSKIIMSFISKEEYLKNPFINNRKDEFRIIYDTLLNQFNLNKLRIKQKLIAPSQIIHLEDSSRIISEFNGFLTRINKTIEEHNKKIEEKDKILEVIKSKFWEYNRWQYDSFIDEYLQKKSKIESSRVELEVQLNRICKLITEKKVETKEQQKKTVNIDEAIENINNGLKDLGISGFFINKYDDSLYKIERNDSCENTFQTLSEGEKMIITFLYFRELCKGKVSIDSPSRKKIIVIDDPISSLSHIFIFNIGQLISVC